MTNQHALERNKKKLNKRRLKKMLNDSLSKKKSIIIFFIAFIFWIFSMLAIHFKWQENITYCTGLAFGVTGFAALIFAPKQPIRTYLGCVALLLLIIVALYSSPEKNQTSLNWMFEKIMFIIFAVIYSSFAVKIFNIHLNDVVAIIIMCVAIATASLIKWPLLPLFHHVLNDFQEEVVIDLLFLISSVIAVELTLDD